MLTALICISVVIMIIAAYGGGYMDGMSESIRLSIANKMTYGDGVEDGRKETFESLYPIVYTLGHSDGVANNNPIYCDKPSYMMGYNDGKSGNYTTLNRLNEGLS